MSTTSVNPSPSYTPSFETGIAVLDPLGNVVSYINPTYCLGLASAQQLAALPELKPFISKVFLGSAWQGNPYFNCPYTTAWFQYLNGATEPAGFVASNFLHGYPYSTAVQNALLEILGTMRDFDQGQS